MRMIPAWLPDTLKIIGGLILLYPALRVSGLARSHYLFDQVDLEKFPNERFRSYLENRKKKLFMKQFEWNLFDQIVLFTGLSLVILGDVLNLFERIAVPAHSP